jgi:ABC-2 type transport system ATP-binding protein
VEATCDRILIINKGKIVADGTSKDLRKQSEGREILKVKIEDGDKNDIFKSLQGLSTIGIVDFMKKDETAFEIQSKPGISSRKEIFKLCVEKRWTLTEMTPIETKLEDVFRELTMN